jgi:hypothetical protein
MTVFYFIKFKSKKEDAKKSSPIVFKTFCNAGFGKITDFSSRKAQKNKRIN